MSASPDRSVGKVMLSDQDGVSRHLDVTVTGKSGESTNVSARVPLTAVSEAFIQGNKLVVTGRAQNAFAVEIFDATTGEKLDWLYCSTPTRVSDQLLVYVESYPDHTPYDYNTVLLAYDLSRSPLDNRLTEEKKSTIPAPEHDSPTRVGIPIFPEYNARRKSYDQLAKSASQIEQILLGIPFLSLGQDLIFAFSVGGPQFPDLTGYLGVVDLSRGIENTRFKRIDIPKQGLRYPGQNPKFVQIKAIEPDGPDAVKLLVFEGVYGVPNILVSLSGTGIPRQRPAQIEHHLRIPPETKYVHIAEAVESASLVNKPPSLSGNNQTTIVRFEALIGPDGSVRMLLPIAGPSELVSAAEKEAMGFTYKPAVLNGEAVSVLTTIPVELPSVP